MKKFFVFTLAAAFLFIMAAPLTWAQESATEEEFLLEDIIVTAEKREANIQKIPASVFVISGEELAELGKKTTAEILEEMPGISWQSSADIIGSGHATPDAGIKIRGIVRKETSDGQPPSGVATYVDGVFEGLGGNYDIARVEVLRGPQGTLYGRSATGGVVAFHTHDPLLGEYGGNVILDMGENELKGVQAAINAPFGESFALRVATRYYTQDGYFNPDGGRTETKEGRAKLLYQPNDKLRVMLTGATRNYRYNGGGITQTFKLNESTGTYMPDTFDYAGSVSDVSYGNYNEMYQGTLRVEYDFGQSNLTYIGSYRLFKDVDNTEGSMRVYPLFIFRDLNYNPGEWFHTEELRWASDSEGWFTWLVGGNYYYSKFDRIHGAVQVEAYEYAGGPEDSPPDSREAPIFQMVMKGHTYNWGLFTEETFNLSDKMRITAGLRYDKSEVLAGYGMNFNTNISDLGNSLNPPIYISLLYEEPREWDNITYKLRWEHDLTPDNMLYALTATGFQPGDVRINILGFSGFQVMPYDEEKLTTYEVGTKNRFFDNRLQLNASLFYYDYDGYRHTINIAEQQGADYILVTTPLRMYGSEIEGMWLLTPQDKLSLNMAWMDAKIDGFPMMETSSGDVSSRNYMQLEDIPGNPPLTGYLRYEHSFDFAGGSTLQPRLTLHYTDGYYLSQMTKVMVDMGQTPYNWQDSYMTGDVGATWTSADGKYSASAYIDNVTDEEYKAGVYLGTSLDGNTVTVGNPRTIGMNLSINF